MRRFAMDAGYLGRRRHIVHGLIEVDVTDARALIREYEQRTGDKLSFTAFIIYCTGKAIQEHPRGRRHRQATGSLWQRDTIREYLDLTVSIDHDVVDGAPAARFVQSLRAYLERAEGLRDLQNSP